MNPPEHYRAAEILLDRADNERLTNVQQQTYLAAAQVHATLALAGATADPDRMLSTCTAKWRAVLG